MRKIISRPEINMLPNVQLPIHIRSTGYNEADPGWREHVPEDTKNFVQIFWSVQGIGEFTFKEKKIKLHPGEFIYHLPFEPHTHRSIDSKVPWHYYWFTFDGPGARDFMLSYGYPQESMLSGECPVRLFHELESLLKRRTVYAQRHAISVATEILALAGENKGDSAEHDLTHRFIDLAQEHFKDPTLTAELLADRLCVHRTTLNRVVKRQLSISPKHYINQLRIQKALSLLLETTLSVKAIAFDAGFNKVDYFCALIRKQTGYTPARYRKHASVDSI